MKKTIEGFILKMIKKLFAQIFVIFIYLKKIKYDFLKYLTMSVARTCYLLFMDKKSQCIEVTKI